MKTMTQDSTLNSQVHDLIWYFKLNFANRDNIGCIMTTLVFTHCLDRSVHRRGLPRHRSQEEECESFEILVFICQV